MGIREEIQWVNRREKVDDVVFKRGLCGWVLPYAVAVQVMKYNPRHLPVVINREMNDEAYYLYLSVRRIVHDYRAGTDTALPPSPFCEDV